MYLVTVMELIYISVPTAKIYHQWSCAKSVLQEKYLLKSHRRQSCYSSAKLCLCCRGYKSIDTYITTLKQPENQLHKCSSRAVHSIIVSGDRIYEISKTDSTISLIIKRQKEYIISTVHRRIPQAIHSILDTS